MPVTSFNRYPGTKQGRIAPKGAAPVAGDYVFCLGHDDPRHFEQLRVNDFIKVEQSNTFTPGTRVFRATVRVRPPEAVPTGLQWSLQLIIDNVIMAQHILAPGARLRTRTLSANVSKFSAGEHTVAVRLVLEDPLNPAPVV